MWFRLNDHSWRTGIRIQRRITRAIFQGLPRLSFSSCLSRLLSLLVGGSAYQPHSFLVYLFVCVFCFLFSTAKRQHQGLWSLCDSQPSPTASSSSSPSSPSVVAGSPSPSAPSLSVRESTVAISPSVVDGSRRREYQAKVASHPPFSFPFFSFLFCSLLSFPLTLSSWRSVFIFFAFFVCLRKECQARVDHFSFVFLRFSSRTSFHSDLHSFP